MRTPTAIRTIGILLLFLSACSQQPQEIFYGSDECEHCKMQISDERFATQMVTAKGKAIKFDAIECMNAYASRSDVDTEGAKFWVSNYDDPGSWLDAETASFIRSEEIQSPMGESLLALESEEAAKDHLNQYPGDLLTWQELINR